MADKYIKIGCLPSGTEELRGRAINCSMMNIFELIDLIKKPNFRRGKRDLLHRAMLILFFRYYKYREEKKQLLFLKSNNFKQVCQTYFEVAMPKD